MGISRKMILTDLMRFAPPALAAIKKKKLMEPLIRRWLEPFYHSPAAAALLAD